MSTKSKVSETTSGCCTRDATLRISPFTKEVLPPAFIFPSENDLYLGDALGNGLKDNLELTSDANDECKNLVIEQLLLKINTALFIGFSRWLKTSYQKYYLAVPFLGIDKIQFTVGGSWEFEIECCNENNSASILTPFDNFPAIIGYRLTTSNVGGVIGVTLDPPISAVYQ